MFLLTGCDCGGAGILKIIKFIWTLLDIVFFIVPIGLIIMLMVDFGKNVMAGKEDEMKKNVNIAIKRIISAVVLFLVPTIVDFSVAFLGELGVEYSECINIARESDLAQYEGCVLFEDPDINKIDLHGNDGNTRNREDYYFTSKTEICENYQPQYKNNMKLEDTGLLVKNVPKLVIDPIYKGKENQKVWVTDGANPEYYVWIGDSNCGGRYNQETDTILKYFEQRKKEQSQFGNSIEIQLKEDYYFNTKVEKCPNYQPRYKDNIKLKDTGYKVENLCESYKKTEEYQKLIKGKENQKIWELSKTDKSGNKTSYYYIWMGNSENCSGTYLDITPNYCIYKQLTPP